MNDFGVGGDVVYNFRDRSSNTGHITFIYAYLLVRRDRCVFVSSAPLDKLLYLVPLYVSVFGRRRGWNSLIFC